MDSDIPGPATRHDAHRIANERILEDVDRSIIEGSRPSFAFVPASAVTQASGLSFTTDS